MNESLISSWNSVVGVNDDIYHLGDFSMTMSTEDILKIVKRLNGNIHFIRGNHDQKITDEVTNYFVWDKPYHEMKLNKQRIVLCHYPFDQWNGSHRGVWHLHGHCVDLNTEILTTDGWVDRSNISLHHKVISYNHSLRKLQHDNIKEIIDFTDYCGDVYELGSKSVDLRVTSEHTMIHFNRMHDLMSKTPAHELLSKNRIGVMRAGMINNPGIGIPLDMLKLYVVIAADGTIKQETNLIRVRVSKQYKKEYLAHLLAHLGIQYTKHENKNGLSSYNFRLPTELCAYNIKGLDKKLLNCTQVEFEAVLEAYQNSDGCKNGNGTIIYSAKKQEIDLLQAMAVQNGYGATSNSRQHGFGENDQYQLSIYPASIQNITDVKQRTIVTKANNEHFWCIKCDNQNFFMRRNGKVHLTGNCHGNLPPRPGTLRMDVGVDCTQYYPISFDQIKQLMGKREYNHPH